MRWPVPATCPCGGSPTAIHGRLAALLTCGCSPPVAATSYGKQGQGGSDLKPLCPGAPATRGRSARKQARTTSQIGSQMTIVWTMAGEAGPGQAFTLEYEVQPQDVQDLLAVTPRVKDKLTIAMVAAMVCGLVATGFTAITMALNYRSAVFSAAGAPGGIYVADLALWLVTAFLAWAAWQRSPARLAQLVLKQTPAFQGRTRAQIETSGIRTISASGTEAFHPWATIDQAWETTHAFHLLDHNGHARAILPKRALDSPDLLRALRTFLKQALAEQRPAV